MFPYSAVITAKMKTDLSGKLKSFIPIVSNRTTPARIGFIFTGQGAQWWGIGRELFHYPIFRTALLKCDAIVESLDADWSLMEELLKDEASSRVNEAVFSKSHDTWRIQRPD